MDTPIRLHQVTTTGGEPRRLNAFAGRHLGERELDLLQAYADDRLAHLLHQRAPGIVAGLALSFSGSPAAARLRISPGLAVGANGRAVSLHYPMDLPWTSLVELHVRRTGALPRDGFYLITLRRGAEIADAGGDGEPCVRGEPDPLRDSRIETVALPGLQLVGSNPRWIAMGAIRAANRICVHHLGNPPFDRETGAVPLALVKVEDALPVWIDTPVGHIESHPDGAYRALLAHTEAAMAAFGRLAIAPVAWVPYQPIYPLATTSGATTAPLSEFIHAENLVHLGTELAASTAFSLAAADTAFAVPWLHPAVATAAPTLDSLSRRHNPGLGGSLPGVWETEGPIPALTLADRLGLDYLPAAGPLPRALVMEIGTEIPWLDFDPRDLQVELTAIPAAVVPAMIERELARGVVDLVHAQHDRIRILAAIGDPDYRPDLMNLPQVDRDLVGDLYRRGKDAFDAYAQWLSQWQGLFNHLSSAELVQAQAPTVPTNPPLANAYLDGLVAARRLELGDETAPLPPPYAGHDPDEDDNPSAPPDDYEPPSFTDSTQDGLYRLTEDLQREIEDLEDDLEVNFDLLQAINDYLTLQRQQLDALAVSFTVLAGGTPGDGSGLNLMRWATDINFKAPDSGAPPNNDDHG